MLSVKLPPDLANAVEKQARLEKTTKAALARAALERYLEDAQDYRDALAASKRRSKTYSLAEIKKRHGLES